MLNISEWAESILEAERIIVLIMSFNESGFIGFKIFLWIHVIGIFFDIMWFGFLAIMDAFFKIVFDNIHFCYYSLNTY